MKTFKDVFLEKVNTTYDRIQAINKADTSGEFLASRVKDLQTKMVGTLDIDVGIDLITELAVISYIVTKEVV